MAKNKRRFSTLATKNDGDTEEDVEIKRRYQDPDPWDLLRSIQGTFDLDTSEALFSVGDKIDLTNTDPDTTHERRGPVTIRWDSGVDQSHVRKISFPAPQTQVPTPDSLAYLLEDCEPATFGRGNQEVLDKSYRHASKMDVQHFSCDFSPYDNRVMEKVSQALAFRDGADNSHRGLRAELYKLNVSPPVLLANVPEIVQTDTTHGRSRSTPHLPACSRRMWIRLARRIRWGRLWFVFQHRTKVCDFKSRPISGSRNFEQR